MKKVNSQNTIASYDVCMDTLRLIGDVWILAIIVQLADADCRFGELQRQIDGINPVTLTNRLKKLEEAELIIRQINTIDKQSVTYQLTNRGKLVLPVINELKKLSLQLAQ